ncbi:MAG: glucose-1-phosphate adenylyltransferase [Thermoguttaceae bacterium]|nr:glucose-1-phosphate adenylyltransferase [Thermoguttaceae bacterium]MDW8079095.1 glucose-1-phosphate adenylyltransferase [Thermoguttaceae bacterium]
MRLKDEVVTVVLAGGKGSRLEPLTRDRAKPAVPFGGAYRIIDFTLSNCLNSGLKKILVLTQHKALSLDRHINMGWSRYFCRELGEFIDIVPPQQRIDDSWYQGTADAVYQNIYTIEKEHPRYVLILAGDHIYKMNYMKMIEYHIGQQADATIGVLRVRREEARRRFGVLEVDRNNRVIGFQEKPDEPVPLPGNPEMCLASMGIYVFNARFLFEELCRDATRRTSRHDFGGDVIPSIISRSRVYAYPFVEEADENRKKDAYWRDVGTVDAYYEANMDLVSVDPQLDLYDELWPIRTYHPNYPPPKFVFADPDRCGRALDSIVCLGCIISGGLVQRSILGPKTRINSYAEVTESILLGEVNVGRYARIRRAIIDKGVSIPPGMEIGFDPELDARRGFFVSPEGITVITPADSLELVEQLAHRPS